MLRLRRRKCWDEIPPGLDEFVRILQSPGTDKELRDLPAQLANFTAPGPSRSWLTLLHPGALASATMLLGTFTAGAVATAAYTAQLPEPVQRAAHRILGPIGVPLPHPHVHPSPSPSPETEHPRSIPYRAPRPDLVHHRRLPTSRPSPTPITLHLPVGSSPKPGRTPTSSPTPQPSATPTGAPTYTRK